MERPRACVFSLLLLADAAAGAYHAPHATYGWPRATQVGGAPIKYSVGSMRARRTSSPHLFLRQSDPPPPPPQPTVPSTQIIRRDLYSYVGLIAIVAAVPAIDWAGLGGADAVNAARLAYFTVVAIGSVYLGVKRQDIGETSPISGNSAALAPIFASVTLGGLYLCLKYTGLNPGSLYQFFACLFALLATADLLQPLLGLGLANELLAPASQDFGEKREAEIMNLGALPAFAVSLALIVAYAQGPETTGGALTTPAFAALNDCLGWSITMAALGVLALESFTAAAALLLGLFLYDAFFVFKSDVMLTVATQIEAPAKFLFARLRAEGDASYPFSVLGLGDVVVPGAFVSLLREVDKDGLEPAEGSRPRAPPIDAAKAAEAPSTYFRAGLGAYRHGFYS